VLIGDNAEGVFAPGTATSRRRVQEVFVRAVVGASDAPRGPVGPALGRLLYLLHLAIILWWLLDKSPQQRATAALISLLEGTAPLVAMALRVPRVPRLLVAADVLVRDALFDDAPSA
jgi:hypothetical protein